MRLTRSCIARVAIVTGQWTTVVAPINCNYWAILGTDDDTALWRCSDTADPTTEHEIPAMSGFALVVPIRQDATRFNVGDTVTFLMGTTNTNAIMEFYI